MKKYLNPEMDVIEFADSDVIRTSDPYATTGQGETPMNDVTQNITENPWDASKGN